MRRSPELEKTAEEEIVVEQRIASARSANKRIKRVLKLRKTAFEKFYQLFTCVVAETDDAAQEVPNGQKFFLHRSVSRYKPNAEQLQKWMIKLFEAPAVRLNECIITLIQPRCSRPARTFRNPLIPPGNFNHNDGIGYGVIVLLWCNREPQNEDDEASHICGNPRCVNPQHLLWERHAINHERDACHRYGNGCRHAPQCLPLDPANSAYVRALLKQQQIMKNSN